MSDESIGGAFDQTNGVADGLEGESDGSAAGEELSAADRDEESVTDGAPVEQDRSGVADLPDEGS